MNSWRSPCGLAVPGSTIPVIRDPASTFCSGCRNGRTNPGRVHRLGDLSITTETVDRSTVRAASSRGGWPPRPPTVLSVTLTGVLAEIGVGAACWPWGLLAASKPADSGRTGQRRAADAVQGPSKAAGMTAIPSAPICSGACRDDRGIRQANADPAGQPLQVDDIGIGHRRTQLDFQGEHPAVVTLDDEIDLVIPIFRAQMKCRGLASCAETRTSRVTSDSNNRPSRVPLAANRPAAPGFAPARRALPSTPSRRAARLGSAR